MAQTATPNLGFQNKFSTTLSSGITASDTTIPLTSLPTPSEGFLVIEPDSSTNFEIIYYTSKTGSAVVCPSVGAGRGQDDSTAASHSSGATVRMDTVAGMFEALQNGSALNAGALGSTPFATGWISSVLPAVSSVAANGNHSYNVTFASSVASYLSPGQRVRLSRTVAAPTQCTSLNGSTQYYSKTSPAGMTFTDNFTVMAWVKLTSYVTANIMSRYDGTTGWILQTNSSGQVVIAGGGTAGAFDTGTSYQSVPLNKWVHIAASLNMSGTSALIYIDGVLVPSSYTNGAASSLIQAGTLQVGASNGAGFFPGKIAQAAVFNAVISNATILTYISQGLSGSETSLISAYSFNNTINDLNTGNANNLTANGSAVATNADSPFALDSTGTPGGTYEWGIVTKVATTVATVQTPEGSAIPTSGGVSAVDMSAWKVPFGFPAQRGKWRLTSIYKVLATQSSPSAATWYNIGSSQLSVPIGEWTLYHWEDFQITMGSSTAAYGGATLSTASNSESEPLLSTWVEANAIIAISIGQTRTANVSLAAQTTYYLNGKSQPASASAIYFRGDNVPTTIEAECAHL